MQEQTNHVVYPASLQSLHQMVAFIKKEAETIGFDPKELNKIEVAAEETLINIISYGYPEKQEGTITIGCSGIKDKQIIIAIEDDGMAFNPLENEHSQNIDTEAPLEERTYGGYGIFLIRTVMDEIHYERRDHRNRLTLKKQVLNHS